MIRSKKTIVLLPHLPAERVLLETDGPFARHGSRPARPSDVVKVLNYLVYQRNATAVGCQPRRGTTTLPVVGPLAAVREWNGLSRC